MNDFPTPYDPSRNSLSAESQQPIQACQYCGAELNPFFYFCLVCSTPYKNVNTVVTPAMPRPLTDEERVNRKAPQVYNIFWTYLGTLLFIGASSLLMREQKIEQLILYNDICIAVVTIILGSIYYKSLLSQLGRIGFDRLAAYGGLLLLIPCLALNFAYHGLLQYLQKSGKPGGEMLSDVMTQKNELFVVITFCILPAITEEIAFRGLVQHWLQTALVPWKAIVVASAMFAAIHLNIISFPYLFVVGLLLGWTKWKTGSIYPSMLIHFLHNLIVVEAEIHQWLK